MENKFAILDHAIRMLFSEIIREVFHIGKTLFREASEAKALPGQVIRTEILY